MDKYIRVVHKDDSETIIPGHPNYTLKENDAAAFYYANGRIHRDGGPAHWNTKGDCLWVKNGLAHSLVGPAIVRENERRWYINGKEYSGEDWETYVGY